VDISTYNVRRRRCGWVSQGVNHAAPKHFFNYKVLNFLVYLLDIYARRASKTATRYRLSASIFSVVGLLACLTHLEGTVLISACSTQGLIGWFLALGTLSERSLRHCGGERGFHPGNDSYHHFDCA